MVLLGLGKDMLVGETCMSLTRALYHHSFASQLLFALCFVRGTSLRLIAPPTNMAVPGRNEARTQLTLGKDDYLNLHWLTVPAYSKKKICVGSDGTLFPKLVDFEVIDAWFPVSSSPEERRLL